jgi:ribonuclease BN (tRNA processing enzyme)
MYAAHDTPEEYALKQGWGHSTYVEAARVAKAANVKKLVLFHHDPGHDDKAMEQIVVQARQHFENTEAAAQGRQICI